MEARAASRNTARPRTYGQLRKNDYLSSHAQTIVQSADVRINPGLTECDSEASYSRRRLREPDAVLGSCLEKARVRTIGRGIENGVTRTVVVDGYVGRRRNKILRFGPEGDGVCRRRIFVRPFQRVARVNGDHGIAESHHRERVRAGACGYYLAATDCYAVFRMQVLRFRGIPIGEQRSGLCLRHTVVKLLVVGQGLGRFENMHNARHVTVD